MKTALVSVPTLISSAMLAGACGSGSGGEEQTIPRVAPNHIEVHSYANEPRAFEGVEGGTVLDDDEGWLYGPFLELKIEETGVVDAFDPPRAAPYRASDGHELVVTYFSEASWSGPPATPMGDERAPEVEGMVEAGDEATPLEGLHLSDAAIVTSVPAGDAPVLEVAHEGRSQAIDLLTGELVATSHGAWEPAAHHIRYRYEDTGQMLEGINPVAPTVEDVAVDLSIEWMARTPWLLDLGYAPDGRAWLIAGPNTPAMVGSGGGQIIETDDPYFNLRASEAFVLVDEAGTEIPAERYLMQQLLLGGGGMLVLEVPDSFTTGTLQVDVGAGTDWLTYGDEEPPSRLPFERRWETPPPADSVEIELVEGTTAPAAVYQTEPVGTHYSYD